MPEKRAAHELGPSCPSFSGYAPKAGGGGEQLVSDIEAKHVTSPIRAQLGTLTHVTIVNS